MLCEEEQVDIYLKQSDVINIFRNYVQAGTYADQFIELIRSIPPADVEPVRHGRWVGMREYCQYLYDTTGERYTMSQLGISLPHCNQCWAENESRKPFCPNCGAKMDEVSDND